MKRSILFFLVVAWIGFQSSCNSDSKFRKDGDVKDILGKIKFDENGEGTFCPCQLNECWILGGGIQFKGLRKFWVMFKQQHDGEDVFAKLDGYYYSLKDKEGNRQGALTIENFKVNETYKDCNFKAN